MWLRQLARSVFVLAWIFCILSRVELFQAYGKGTGTNRLGFSPLDVSCYFAQQQARLRGMSPQTLQYLRQFFQVVGLPGEIVSDLPHLHKLHELPKWPNQVNAAMWWSGADQWVKETKLKKLLSNKDGFSGLVSLSASLGAIVALVLGFRKEASLIFIASMVGLQITLRAYEPSVKLDETWGVYSIAFALASHFL